MINLMLSKFFLSVSFGELELPLSTVYILIGITIFVFAGVGISSLQLVKSALEEKDEDSN